MKIQPVHGSLLRIGAVGVVAFVGMAIAEAATRLADDMVQVNCPVVFVAP